MFADIRRVDRERRAQVKVRRKEARPRLESTTPVSSKLLILQNDTTVLFNLNPLLVCSELAEANTSRCAWTNARAATPSTPLR